MPFKAASTLEEPSTSGARAEHNSSSVDRLTSLERARCEHFVRVWLRSACCRFFDEHKGICFALAVRSWTCLVTDVGRSSRASWKSMVISFYIDLQIPIVLPFSIFADHRYNNRCNSSGCCNIINIVHIRKEPRAHCGKLRSRTVIVVGSLYVHT